MCISWTKCLSCWVFVETIILSFYVLFKLIQRIANGSLSEWKCVCVCVCVCCAQVNDLSAWMGKVLMPHAIDMLTLVLRSMKDCCELRTYVPDGYLFSLEQTWRGAVGQSPIHRCLASIVLFLHRQAGVHINPYPTAFPYGNGMVLHFYQQQESSTTKTVHKVINKGLKAYV